MASNDEIVEGCDFVEEYKNLRPTLDKLELIINECRAWQDRYEELDETEQCELNLFVSYAYNSLYWIHLRSKGVDVTDHPIQSELKRINDAMRQFKEIKDKKYRPKVNNSAVKRFIRSSLWELKQCEEANKKKKRLDKH